MKQILNKLLDVIFPPRETQLILRESSIHDIQISSACYEGVFFCTHYSHPTIKAAVRENKFYNNSTAQYILNDCFSRWIEESKLHDICIIPVPLGASRFKDRGHNQVLSVLKRSSFPCAVNAISRQIETTPQTSLSRVKRLKNIEHIFICNKAAMRNISQSTIILLDDVVTTGATLNEARATLAPHLSPGQKLICVALAH